MYFHSLLPAPCLPSRRASPTSSDVVGASGGYRGGVQERVKVCLETVLFIYAGAPGQRGQIRVTPLLQPQRRPNPLLPVFDFTPSSPAGWQVRGWELSQREQRRQGPAADVRASAPVNEQQRLPGDCSGNEAADVIASCWTRGGGCCPSTSVAGLKENSLSSRSRGEWLFRAQAPPPPCQVHSGTRVGH